MDKHLQHGKNRSQSETKRYLSRKKSADADNTDQFKRINNDKNLRIIKSRAPEDVDDDGPHIGCHTEQGWLMGDV